jgi:long-chain acyl-CoA synthetase
MTTDTSIGTAPFQPADPDAVCAIEGDRTLTWQEWNDQANRLAAVLDGLGVGSGDVVAARTHTRLEWLVVYLAVAKVDAVLVATNYRLAPPESTHILRDCKVKVAVLDDRDIGPLVEAWRELGLAGIISIEDDAPGAIDYATALATASPRHRPAKDTARLIIYSSGTTGAPKGAPLGGWTEQRDPTVRADYGRSVGFDGAGGGPDIVSLVNVPTHHGAGPGQIHGALAAGGTVVLERKFDPEQALALIEKYRVTSWIGVPTMLRRVMKLPEDVLSRYDVSSLRFLGTGAAPVSGDLKRWALDYFGDCLYERYGCTEAGMIAGSTPQDLRHKPDSSGRPFRHVTIRILDEDGVEVPPGVTGEITVKTPAIISGFIGRGPLGADLLDHDGFYHTGDIGHVDDEGYLFIYDRRTDMIIAGGVNIYPAEIEAVLGQHPDVAISAVIGVPYAELGEQPWAIVERKPGSALTEADLLGYCAGRLAKYKWPRGIDFVDTVPVNAMGKLLKRELRAPYWANSERKI